MAAEIPRQAFAATWRRQETGEIVGTTWGGTMCWFPLRPWRLRIARDDFLHIVRCGECPGCLEFERRRLADRLRARYSPGTVRGAGCQTSSTAPTASSAAGQPRRLFLVKVYAPLTRHAALSRSLHRRKKLELEPGFFRLGVNCFGLLAHCSAPLCSVLGRTGLKHHVEPILFRRGRRAWRSVTAGLMVSRDAYGANHNRFYSRGLPAAERKKWEVIKRAWGKGYQRFSSPRGWSGDRLVLVPPEVWGLRAGTRASLRDALRGASDPAGVAKVMEIVAEATRGTNLEIAPSRPPANPLSRQQIVDWFASVARRRQESTARERDPKDHQHQLGGAGYVTSGQPENSKSEAKLSLEELEQLRARDGPAAERSLKEGIEAAAKQKVLKRERDRRMLSEALERLKAVVQRRNKSGE